MSSREFYDRYWKNEHVQVNAFDTPPEWTEENFLYHLNFFQPFVAGRVLDFGCGRGQFAQKLKGYCDAVSGVDVSFVALERARNDYPEIEFKLLEQDRIPYADRTFDAVFALDVLEHLLDVETVLEELNRVLKPGGFLLIATSQITRLKMVLIALSALDTYFYPTSPHVRYFTRRNLADILRKKCFEPVRYQKNRTYFGFIPQGQLLATRKI